jgi:hypothetical protein
VFPSRYGRRNSGGDTRTHRGGGVSKLFVQFSPPRPWVGGFVGWELRSGRVAPHTVCVFCVCCGDVVVGQALGLLVPVGWALLLYTSGLSTQCSAGGLTPSSGWETSS